MRNPFKRKSELPPITNAGYHRWLRAQQPPMDWFAEFDEETQEQLAMIGDDYQEDFAIATAVAMTNTDAAALGAAVGDDEDEMAEIMAARVASSIINGQDPQQAPPAKKPLTMGGIGERRSQQELEATEAKRECRTLFGRKPDEVTA